MSKATFSLDTFKFEKVSIDFSNNPSGDIFLEFKPKGEFSLTNQIFNLFLDFSATDESGNVLTQLECSSEFTFSTKITFEEIPQFFYVNSIAIIFPYIRSFVSTVTLQANIRPLILPIMNLTDLEGKLRANTSQV